MTSSAFSSTGLSPVRFVSLSRFPEIKDLKPEEIKGYVSQKLGTNKIEIDIENNIAIASG